jgi:hypothetical protein
MNVKINLLGFYERAFSQHLHFSISRNQNTNVARYPEDTLLDEMGSSVFPYKSFPEGQYYYP